MIVQMWLLTLEWHLDCLNSIHHFIHLQIYSKQSRHCASGHSFWIFLEELRIFHLIGEWKSDIIRKWPPLKRSFSRKKCLRTGLDWFSIKSNSSLFSKNFQIALDLVVSICFQKSLKIPENFKLDSAFLKNLKKSRLIYCLGFD